MNNINSKYLKLAIIILSILVIIISVALISYYYNTVRLKQPEVTKAQPTPSPPPTPKQPERPARGGVRPGGGGGSSTPAGQIKR